MHLELNPGEGGEGALVAEEVLTLCVVFAPPLELSMFGSHVFEKTGFPSGPVVTFITLQPLLLMPRGCVSVEVTQVVGAVLAVAPGEDMPARV